MSRYVGGGKLHKLCEGGPMKKSGWTEVLAYMEVHSVIEKTAQKPPFDSPLPSHTTPSPGLKKELLIRQGPRKEDTPLRLAIRLGAPSQVIAAMLHLCSNTAQIPDSRGRLPLHLACRRPTTSSDEETIIRFLVQAHPNGMVHTDDCGRVPLHYLMWYHASTRPTRLIEYFIQPIPLTWLGNIEPPGGQAPSAAMISDSKHGCLPLHYAIMQGASREVVKMILQAHPLARTQPDKEGRSPLSWYLGAGHGLHVSGEPPDPKSSPLHKQKRSNTILSLLLNSKSARMVDSKGRCALHWACHLLGLHYYHKEENELACLDLRVIKSLLDHYIDAVLLQDSSGMTPLHLMFDAVAVEQAATFLRIERNKIVRNSIDLQNGGGKGGFEPPVELIELLLKIPDDAERKQPLHLDQRTNCAAHVEDPQGRLPLHLALLTVSTPDIIKIIIQAHPNALVHTAEDMQTPLHCALTKPYTAPLQRPETMQLLLQAYVTSRHGTFVNGKLALKMEDSNGFFPLHYACCHQACFRLVKLLLDCYPKAARVVNGNGDLPLHCLLDANYLFESEFLSVSGGASLAIPMGWVSDVETDFPIQKLKLQQELMRILIQKMDQESMQIASSGHGMLPLHIVVAFDAVDYSTLYRVLDSFPEGASMWTTAKGHEYTALDLHEMRQRKAENDRISHAKWMNIRELLFAFGPYLNDHRNKDDLLEQCAKVIRDEAGGKGCVHAAEFKLWLQKQKDGNLGLEIKETLSSIQAPEDDRGSKPKSKKNQSKPFARPTSKGLSTIKTVTSLTSSTTNLRSPKNLTPLNKKKSIYDDDEFDHRYVVSEQNESDDDYFDDDEFLVDEDYDNLDDPRYKNDDFDDEEDERKNSDAENRTRQTRNDETRTSKTSDDETKTFESNAKGINEHNRGSSGIQTKNTFDGESLNFSQRFVEEGKKDKENAKKLSAEEGISETVPFFSEVAMRLWTFFLTFRNSKNVYDNYAKTVEWILHKLPFPSITEMINLSLPSYGVQYLFAISSKNFNSDAVHTPLRDVAHNACKAVIHKAEYFVGKFQFSLTPQDCLVIHRSNDGMSVYVRAVDHVIETEEVVPVQEIEGDVEESIWATGVQPDPVEDKVSSVFNVASKKVCIKFMKSYQAYMREINCRRSMKISVSGKENNKHFVVPLLDHFNATDKESRREQDSRYKFDIEDERFTSIDLGGGESLNPAEFPFAVVLPFRDNGNLFDYFLHHGCLAMNEIREIGIQIGKALHAIHQKELVHCSVSFSSIMLVTPADDLEETETYWALTDFAGACNLSTSSMAGISSTGAPNYMTSTFPPELFVKLNPSEVKIYNTYWEKVESIFGVKVDPLVITPHVDQATGDSYVLKCYYESESDDIDELPKLPYKLLPAREAIDIWSFGRVMFTLLTAGHPMFATNIKTGHLLAYNEIATFDQIRARNLIYKNVKDPLAQDLLFLLLSSFQERSSLTMEKILNHPFFIHTDMERERKEQFVKQIVESRTQDSLSFIRSVEERNTRQAEGEWVTNRSKILHCWSFEFSIRMYLTPSTLLRNDIKDAPDIPLSLVLLPYKFARNRSGKLTPSTKNDVERAERMGVQLLELVKACQFACRMETVVEDPEKFDFNWTSTELLQAMNLEEGFKEYVTLMTQLAATEVERFRDNPLYIARTIVQRYIQRLSEGVLSKGKSYLYLADEFTGIPVLQSPYPLEVSGRAEQVFNHTLPLMYASVLYSCAVAGSVSGLVKLIFEAAYPHIPPSWSSSSSSGMTFQLDKDFISQQVSMIQTITAGSFDHNHRQNLDDLKFLQNYLQVNDIKNSYAQLKKITNGEAGMWTADVEAIGELCEKNNIFHAHKMYERQQEKISEYEKTIERLKKALENAEFKRKHNLLDIE